MTERRVSIAEARAKLPGLVRDAEGGTSVEITRRGRPVAVLLSSRAYQRLASGRPPFGTVLDDFLGRMEIRRIGLRRGEFKALRARDVGREARW